MVHKFLNKKNSGAVATLANKSVIKNEIFLIKNSRKSKPITWKFEKRKVHSPFIDNIWSENLTDMQLISKFNKGFRFLLWVIDYYSKYPWFINLKYKQGITITNAFQKITD